MPNLSAANPFCIVSLFDDPIYQEVQALIRIVANLKDSARRTEYNSRIDAALQRGTDVGQMRELKKVHAELEAVQS